MIAPACRQLLALTAAVLLAAACGDDPLPAGQDAATDAADGATLGDLGGLDATGPGDAADDTQPADATADSPDATPADTATDAAPADVPPADTGVPDTAPPVDATVLDTADAGAPFVLVQHSPSLGASAVAQPVQFTLEFNLKVKAESISKNTVFVTTHGEVPVNGQFQVDETKVTFKASGTVSPASRVQVRVTNLVQAQKGWSLQEEQVFHFYTAPMPDLQPYEKLAARYAPTLRQGLSPAAKFDLLRSPDFDDNWNADDNAANINKFDAMAKVGWSVIETHSHFFIAYVFFWPRRVPEDQTTAFDNDSAGSIVTVAKFPQEHPVALTTWFKGKAKVDEQMWAWVTQESGLLPPGVKAESANLRGVLPEAELFPKPADANDTFGCEGLEGCTPRRYPGYLSGGGHHSCLWLDAGDKTFKQCLLDALTKSTLKYVDYVPAAQAAPATTSTKTPVPYALQSLHAAWYPHRDEAGEGRLFEDAVFTYAPPADRPAGPKFPVGSKFRTTGDADFGRPPWAWMWKPGTNASYYQMPRGTPFLDPAWALYQRLGGEGAKIASFDAKTQKGLSLDFCLHPFFFVDERKSTACQPALK